MIYAPVAERKKKYEMGKITRRRRDSV